MGRSIFSLILVALVSAVFISTVSAQVCVECHKKVTPGIVNDWQLSKHHKNKISC
jgi:hypothetical protein